MRRRLGSATTSNSSAAAMRETLLSSYIAGKGFISSSPLSECWLRRRPSWPGSARPGAARPASSGRRAATARRCNPLAMVALVQREQRLDRLRVVGVIVGPRIAVLGDASGHGRDRLRVGIDRVELVPRERRRHLRARPGAHAPRAEHGLVRRVLVEVDEDPLAALFLPPRVGDQRRDGGARARARTRPRPRAPGYGSQRGCEPHVHVDAAVAGGLRVADDAELVEQRAARSRPRPARRRSRCRAAGSRSMRSSSA